MTLHAGMIAFFALALCLSGCEKRGLSARLREEARVARAAGRAGDADRALQRALEYDPYDEAALEQLVELRLQRGDAQGAMGLSRSLPEGQKRSAKLENLLLRARILEWPDAETVRRAARLESAGQLGADTQSEIITALVSWITRCSTEPTHANAVDVRSSARELPEAWFVSVAERLIADEEWVGASSIIAIREPSPARTRLEHSLLERLHAEDFAVSDEILDGVTREPREPLAYLGRLELLLRGAKERDASRLEPPKSLLQGELALEWDERWARYLARRGDWYGVLGRTQVRAPSSRAEARRLALRTIAYLRSAPDHRRARAELKAWLAEPEAAKEWGNTLLLPEIAAESTALNALRAELERPSRR